MRSLPDNNADGAEGTIPYKYQIFCGMERWGSRRGGGSGVYSFEECIFCLQF